MLAPWSFFKSLFTDSSHVKFGCHLPLFSLRIGASADLQFYIQLNFKFDNEWTHVRVKGCTDADTHEAYNPYNNHI
jgi:hypothetical protein